MGLVVSRETQHMGVPYYVDKRFEKEYHGAALDELEKSIESDYIEYLQNSCWKEKQQSKEALNTDQMVISGMAILKLLMHLFFLQGLNLSGFYMSYR